MSEKPNIIFVLTDDQVETLAGVGIQLYVHQTLISLHRKVHD